MFHQTAIIFLMDKFSCEKKKKESIGHQKIATLDACDFSYTKLEKHS